MDPRLGSNGCPCLLGDELGVHGSTFHIQRHTLGLELDVGHLYAVEVCVELDVLNCIVDVLGDVVVQQVLVEAGGDEPHTHGAHEAAHALFHEAFIGIGAEELVVTDLSECSLTGEEPCRAAYDQVRIELGEVDGGTVVGALVPGIHAPDVVLGDCGDGLLEGSAVAHGVLHRITILLHLGGTFLGNKVHDTAQGDTPSLCGSVGGAVNGNCEVGLVLGVVLVYAVSVCAAGVGDRYEVYVLPCAVVVGAVRAVCGNGADGVVPDVQDAYELLCEALEGCGSGEVVCGDVLGKGAALLVLGESTEEGHHETVGGEGDGLFSVTGDEGLVGNGALILCGVHKALGHVCEVFRTFGNLGAAGHGDFSLVVAVAVGMVGRLVVEDDDVVLGACG